MSDASLIGPRSRWEAGLEIAPRTCTDGGVVAEYGVRNIAETMLDRLFGLGLLGDLEASRGYQAARIRRDAGLVLRDLHNEARIASGVAFRYEPRTGYRPHEKSDHAYEAETALRNILRKATLKPYLTVVTNVCCYDVAPQPQRLATLLKGLDLLAAELGIVSRRSPRIKGVSYDGD